MLKRYLTSLSLLIILLMTGCSDPIAATDDAGENAALDEAGLHDVMEEDAVLSKGIFTDQDQMEHPVRLIDNGDGVYLNISDSQIGLESPHSSLQQDTYSMKMTNSLIAVYIHSISARRYSVLFDFFTYDKPNIQNVFSWTDMSCVINNVQLEKGEVTIRFPNANVLLTYPLTNMERERTEQVQAELRKSGITINDEFMESIADGISCTPIEIAFADVDQDGKDDVLFLLNVHTVGAKTPARVNANIVLLFEIRNRALYFNRVEFEKQQEEQQSLFTYFPEKLVREK